MSVLEIEPLKYDDLMNPLVTVQALLLSERQAAEEARKSGMNAEARNTELTKKLEDAGRKVDQLQESVQRSVNTCDVEPSIIIYCYCE